MFRRWGGSLITFTVLILVSEITIIESSLDKKEVKYFVDKIPENVGKIEQGKSEETPDELASVARILQSVFAHERPYITDTDPSVIEKAVEDVWSETQRGEMDFLGDMQHNIQAGNSFDRKARSFTNTDEFRGNGPVSVVGVLSDLDEEVLSSIEGGRYGYLNEWVVHLEGGPSFADRVLEQLGYESKGQVTGFPDLYRVVKHDHPRLHKRAASELTDQLNSHQQVVWAEQQESRVRTKRGSAASAPEGDSDRPLVRVKRTPPQDSLRGPGDRHRGERQGAQDGSNEQARKARVAKDEVVEKLSHFPYLTRSVSSKGDLSDIFNDELVDNQWYLYDTRVMASLPRLDLGVVGAWRRGVTGAGVRVTILDDGIEYTHEDLRDNYDPTISHDFNDDDDDPLPRMSSTAINSHGTKCAGEVVMAANNAKCGVGVAFGARVGGIRMLDGHVSDRVEAESLSYARELVDIVSCSWGPTDDGKTVEKPGRLAEQAFERGVKEGRDGKGTIFIWASGNGGMDEDNCNCDGYASSIYTTSITSASQSNKFPWYGERCASTIASTYSSGAYSDQKIITTDVNNGCTTSFSGTSAAAPLAAGIVALALEANPQLTWRDVQHLTVISSNYDPLKNNEGWYQNGRGLWVNLRFGFGLLDADRMVQLAASWQTVPRQVSCSVNAKQNRSDGSFSSQGSATFQFSVAECAEARVGGVFLEQVQAVLSIQHSRRGALQVQLTSPRGTETVLLTPRRNDQSTEGFIAWPFTSVHTWGEDPRGTWTLTVLDTSSAGESGRVTAARLVLYATAEVPHYATGLDSKQFGLQATTSGAGRHG